MRSSSCKAETIAGLFKGIVNSVIKDRNWYLQSIVFFSVAGERIHSKMATSDKLEASLGQGIKSVKENMKNMNQKAKDMNERAERMEKELAVAKQAHIKAYGRLQALKERKIDVEERIEKNNDKIKDITKRLNEKEKFVEESKKFAKSLKVIVPEEHEVMEMEERLRVQKEIYAQHYEVR